MVIDGINGLVSGAEGDDTTWRSLYECTIRPLKSLRVAITSADNLGKDTSKGLRGSSVKNDKPNAVMELSRTVSGVRLKTTHRRSAVFSKQQQFDAVLNDDGEPIAFGHPAGGWPTNVIQLAAELDRLGLPPDTGRERARLAMTAAGVAAATDVLRAAISYRKSRPENLTWDPQVRSSENLTVPTLGQVT